MIKRLGNLIMGFLHLFTTALEERNPEVLLGLEQENLRKQLGNYNRGLSAHAGLCERLITQVKRLENEERSLRAQTTTLALGETSKGRGLSPSAADRRARSPGKPNPAGARRASLS